MKIYNILIGIAIVLTIVIISIPQLTGTEFVNNEEERIPSDWLSELILKSEKKYTLSYYQIPNNTKVIKIIGSSKNTSGHSWIEMKTDNDSQNVSSYQLENFIFRSSNDTLIIKEDDTKFGGSLTLSINSNIKKIILNNLSLLTTLMPPKSAKFELTIENNSNIILNAQQNINLNSIDVKGKSTLTLTNCFMPNLDLQIDNSMVNVDDRNNIDSLKANLIGKSNIKKRNNVNEHDTYKFEETKKALNITHPQVNIYPTGNLHYYNLSSQQ